MKRGQVTPTFDSFSQGHGGTSGKLAMKATSRNYDSTGVTQTLAKAKSELAPSTDGPQKTLNESGNGKANDTLLRESNLSTSKVGSEGSPIRAATSLSNNKSQPSFNNNETDAYNSLPKVASNVPTASDSGALKSSSIAATTSESVTGSLISPSSYLYYGYHKLHTRFPLSSTEGDLTSADKGVILTPLSSVPVVESNKQSSSNKRSKRSKEKETNSPSTSSKFQSTSSSFCLETECFLGSRSSRKHKKHVRTEHK